MNLENGAQCNANKRPRDPADGDAAGPSSDQPQLALSFYNGPTPVGASPMSTLPTAAPPSAGRARASPKLPVATAIIASASPVEQPPSVFIPFKLSALTYCKILRDPAQSRVPVRTEFELRPRFGMCFVLKEPSEPGKARSGRRARRLDGLTWIASKGRPLAWDLPAEPDGSHPDEALLVTYCKRRTTTSFKKDAYHFFSDDIWAELKRTHPELSGNRLKEEVKARWQKLADSARRAYKAKEAVEERSYLRSILAADPSSLLVRYEYELLPRTLISPTHGMPASAVAAVALAAAEAAAEAAAAKLRDASSLAPGCGAALDPVAAAAVAAHAAAAAAAAQATADAIAAAAQQVLDSSERYRVIHYLGEHAFECLCLPPVGAPLELEGGQDVAAHTDTRELRVHLSIDPVRGRQFDVRAHADRAAALTIAQLSSFMGALPEHLTPPGAVTGLQPYAPKHTASHVSSLAAQCSLAAQSMGLQPAAAARCGPPPFAQPQCGLQPAAAGSAPLGQGEGAEDEDEEDEAEEGQDSDGDGDGGSPSLSE